MRQLVCHTDVRFLMSILFNFSTCGSIFASHIPQRYHPALLAQQNVRQFASIHLQILSTLAEMQPAMWLHVDSHAALQYIESSWSWGFSRLAFTHIFWVFFCSIFYLLFCRSLCFLLSVCSRTLKHHIF